MGWLGFAPIAVLATLGAALVGMAYNTGLQVQRQLVATVDQLRQLPGYAQGGISYRLSGERDLFTARYRLDLSLANAANQTTTIPLELAVSHDLLDATLTLTLADSPLRDRLQRYQQNPHSEPFVGHFKYRYDLLQRKTLQHGRVTFDDLKLPLAQGRLELAGLRLYLSHSQPRLSLQLEAERLAYQDGIQAGVEALELAGVQLLHNVRLDPAGKAAGWSNALNARHLSLSAEHSRLRMDNLQLDINREANKAGDYYVTAGRAEAIMLSQPVLMAPLHFASAGLEARLLSRAQAVEASAESRWWRRLVDHRLRGGIDLDLQVLQLSSFDAQIFMAGKGRLEPLTLGHLEADGRWLLQRFTGRFDSSMDASLVQDMSLAQRQPELYNHYLQQGWLTRSGDRLHSQLILHKGRFLMNGRDVAQP